MENATILTPPKSVFMLIFEDHIDMLSPANLEQRGSCMVWEINMGVCPR